MPTLYVSRDHSSYDYRLNPARFQQPSVLYGFVSDWIGFSEHWDIASLSEGLQPVVAALQADAAKQEAVVQAFKAGLASFLVSSVIQYCVPIACLVSVWYDTLLLNMKTDLSPHFCPKERDAMGADEYHPISREGTNLTSAGGIGFTVADTLDTMLIMGLNEEYQRARRWVEDKLTFDKDGAFSTFEVSSFYLLTTSSSP